MKCSDISVGEYVRTEQGYIGKVKNNWVIDEKCKLENDEYILRKTIVKHSKNIIDLIKKDDYVNGCKVYEVRKDEIVVYLDRQPINCYNYIMADEIKSIVTKEQIKQIEFRIKE